MIRPCTPESSSASTWRIVPSRSRDSSRLSCVVTAGKTPVQCGVIGRAGRPGGEAGSLRHYVIAARGVLARMIISSVKAGTNSHPAALQPGDWRAVEALFDHVPDTAFFVKDRAGRYLAVNQSFVERCGLRDKREITGRSVREIFPPDLAARYEAQDEAVLQTGRAIHDR